ncbi:MAG: DNA gyrase inhibitor YacG [Methylotenera sp.]|nr:DNA gyrase inhibitor YacG [Methylotenera sp.]MSP99408.1 DNA gyrase inhibitor YacG [Methylotenera sp.]
MQPVKKRLVACPKCSNLSEFSPSNAFRPFCSERCKLIDLGLWASEGYTIPEEIKPEHLTDEF